MKKLPFLLIALIAIATCGITSSVAGDKVDASSATPKTDKIEAGAEIQWLGYDAGIQKAKKEGKPIVIDFYTDWCGYCKKMDKSTFKDSKVVDYVKQNFVAIRVNGDSQKMVSHNGEQLSERVLTNAYGVRGYPTFWFLDSEGKQIGPAPGYKSTDAFLNLLEYVGGSHYKSMSLENFIKSKSDNG